MKKIGSKPKTRGAVYHPARPTRARKTPVERKSQDLRPVELIVFNKPYRVMSQFRRPEDGRATLADFISKPDVYPAGRLDYDSEGLLLLCSDGRLQSLISHPRFKMEKTYLAQVDGAISEEAANRLRKGITLTDGPARALAATRIDEPELWPRDPPVRFRANIPTSWLRLTINEGRNRQVRRMTAAVGFPTLRLIRERVGPWQLDGLQPGESRQLLVDPAQLIALPNSGL